MIPKIITLKDLLPQLMITRLCFSKTWKRLRISKSWITM